MASGDAPRVLIVEDDLSLAEMIHLVLCDAGLQVDGFSSAERALRHLDLAPWPDLFLLDLGLGAGMNGAALLRELRGRRSAQFPPVLLMTGATQSPESVRALEVQGVLPKPFAVEQLLAKVNRLLSRPADAGAAPRQSASCAELQRRVLELEARLASIERYAQERAELISQEMVNAGASLRLSAEAFHQGCAGGAQELGAPAQADALRFRRSSEWMVRLVRRLLDLEARARAEAASAGASTGTQGEPP